MTPEIQLFFILLLTGLILLGAEVFVPGGIVGSIGGLALIGAVVMGFDAFPGYGWMIAFGIVGLMAVAIGVWIRYFPRSPIGRKMTVNRNLADCKATDPDRKSLVGKRGVTVSELRPSGFALIAGRRMDVIAQGQMIDLGTAVEVVKVEGIRVLVKRVPPEKNEIK